MVGPSMRLCSPREFDLLKLNGNGNKSAPLFSRELSSYLFPWTLIDVVEILSHRRDSSCDKCFAYLSVIRSYLSQGAISDTAIQQCLVFRSLFKLIVVA